MRKKLLIVLSEDAPGHEEEYATWNAEHIEVMSMLPGIISAQAFRADAAFEEAMGERSHTPRYRHLNVFEVDADFPGPRAGTPLPDQPGGTGPNRPAPFMFVAVTDEFRKDQS
ncbi:MAG: hypothetical protein QM626_13605 [Microbacterium sp.]|uniref:hypothetical protein n=1 Tax=Microbacterium sp. TaxID=51671 RepID=UPI0039E250AA